MQVEDQHRKLPEPNQWVRLQYVHQRTPRFPRKLLVLKSNVSLRLIVKLREEPYRQGMTLWRFMVPTAFY
jgi:hypothetical protein